jgi:hypothetical protein
MRKYLTLDIRHALTRYRQWGNVLTLQAAYMNKILRPLVLDLITIDGLRELLEKTMGFLLLAATPSSALYTDWKILKEVGRRTGLLGPSGPNTSSSFSSTGADVPPGQ